MIIQTLYQNINLTELRRCNKNVDRYTCWGGLNYKFEGTNQVYISDLDLYRDFLNDSVLYLCILNVDWVISYLPHTYCYIYKY